MQIIRIINSITGHIEYFEEKHYFVVPTTDRIFKLVTRSTSEVVGLYPFNSFHVTYVEVDND